jgi:hypothetical protein
VPILALASSEHDTHTVSNKSEPPSDVANLDFFHSNKPPKCDEQPLPTILKRAHYWGERELSPTDIW